MPLVSTSGKGVASVEASVNIADRYGEAVAKNEAGNYENDSFLAVALSSMSKNSSVEVVTYDKFFTATPLWLSVTRPKMRPLPPRLQQLFFKITVTGAKTPKWSTNSSLSSHRHSRAGGKRRFGVANPEQ